VMPGMDHPLNLKPEHLTVGTIDELKNRVGWPIAFYEETSNPWPCTFLDFAPNVDDPWATAILEGPLPLQIFIDRLYTFIMSYVPERGRQMTFVSEALGEAADDLVNGVMNEFFKIKGIASDEIKKLIAHMEWPELKKDLWQILSMSEDRFEDLSGMSPLVLGAETERQTRSANEYQGREAHAMSRPKAYAQTMLDWHGRVAQKEAQALRLHCGPHLVAPLFGEDPSPFLDETGDPVPIEQVPLEAGQISPLAWHWGVELNTDDAREAAGDYLFSCAVGTGQLDNRQKLLSDAQTLTQTLLPEFMARANPPINDPAPFNQLMSILAEAYKVPLDKIQLKPMPPPMLPPMPGQVPPEQGGAPGEQPPQGPPQEPANAQL